MSLCAARAQSARLRLVAKQKPNVPSPCQAWEEGCGKDDPFPACCVNMAVVPLCPLVLLPLLGPRGNEGAREFYRAFLSPAWAGEARQLSQIRSGAESVGFPWQIRVLSACLHGGGGGLGA